MDVVKLSGPLKVTAERRRQLFYLQEFILSKCEHIIMNSSRTYHRTINNFNLRPSYKTENLFFNVLL